MEMPIVRGNAAFLPIRPARIFFDGGPELHRGERKALSEAGLGTPDINADQNAPNIEDDGTQFGRHCLLALRFGDGRTSWHGICVTWPQPLPQNTDNRRQDRKKNDRGDDVMKIFPDVGDPGAGHIAPKQHAADPKGAAKDVVDQITVIRHLSSAGDGRTEGAHDRNETRQDYSPATIFFVEFVRSLEMAAAEEE